MKAFFWKPFIIDPAKPEHKTIVWSKVKQHDINDAFLNEVVEAFHDKKAIAASASAGASDGVIKVAQIQKK